MYVSLSICAFWFILTSTNIFDISRATAIYEINLFLILIIDVMNFCVSSVVDLKIEDKLCEQSI